MAKTRKEKNMENVVKVALESFIEKGIDNSKIADIAKSAGLTERTVFRYFDTKADLVVNALLLFWEKSKRSIALLSSKAGYEEKSGIEQMEIIIRGYADLYFTSINELIFYHEAQTYLYRTGKAKFIEDSYIIPYKPGSVPFAKAIEKGKADGTVCTGIESEIIYYNSFDSLSGLIQKLALIGGDDPAYKKYAGKRIADFCSTLIRAYKK